MQTKNLKKKGFTLVELVVVVAVIAVLSAILIPTIGCFVEQAKETNDMATVRLLNTALVEDEAANGTPATMTEALAAMAKKGYLVDKLTPRSSGEILWDSLNNRFLLKNKDGDYVYRDNTTKETKDVNLWKVAKNAADMSDKYSNYLVLDDSFNGDIGKISTGLDVGENTGITAIRYENTSDTAKNVVIRTNGGKLTVDAPADTVYHYGKSGKVVITAVARASYHENGEVEGDIVIEQGRIELAASAKVGTVFVSSVNSGAVIIDVVNGAKIGTVAPTTEAAKADVDASTSIPEESKHEEVVEANTDFAGGLGTERSPYLISENAHLAKITAGTAQNKKYYKLIADIDASTNHNVNDTGYVVKTVVNTLAYSVFDGANHSIKIADGSRLFYKTRYSEIKDIKADIKNNLVYYATNTTFNNVDLAGKISITRGNQAAYVVYAEPGSLIVSLTFIDCDCSVDFQSDGAATSYNAVFTGYAYPNYITVLNYTNCTYSGTFVSGKAAMFLGNNSANLGVVTIKVNSCVNKGIIQSTYIASNYYWNSYMANGIKNDAADNSFKQNSVYLNGNKLTAENISEPLSTGFIQGPNDANLKLAQNADGTFTLTASQNPNAAYYIVTVGLYTDYKAGGTLVQNINERIEKSAIVNNNIVTALKNREFVDKAWVEENSSATAQTYGEGSYAYTVYTLNGKEYYYLPNNNEAYLVDKVKAAQMICVSCYNADGVLIASATLSK